MKKLANAEEHAPRPTRRDAVACLTLLFLAITTPLAAQTPKRPHASAPHTSTTPADSSITPGSKAGTVRVAFPDGTVEASAMFCDMVANDGESMLIMFVGEKVRGAFRIPGIHKGAGSYPVSDTSARDASGKMIRLDRMETFPAASGQVTITEWSKLVVGSFRFTGSTSDGEGVSHTRAVTGAFRAKYQC